MAKENFPTIPVEGSRSVPCSMSLPISVRNELGDVAAHLGVSNSALVTCILRVKLRQMAMVIHHKPEVLDWIDEQASVSSEGGNRLRGAAGENVSLKVRLLEQAAAGLFE